MPLADAHLQLRGEPRAAAFEQPGHTRAEVHQLQPHTGRELVGGVHEADRTGDVNEPQRGQVRGQRALPDVAAHDLIDQSGQHAADLGAVGVVDLTGQPDPGRAGPVSVTRSRLSSWSGVAVSSAGCRVRIVAMSSSG